RHTRSKRDWSSDVCSSDLFNCRYCPPQVGHRVSEGTASWSDLNDGAGGLFYKVDDGVDDLVVGEKILAMFVTAVSVCRHQVCSLELMIWWSVRKFWPCSCRPCAYADISCAPWR